MTLQDESILSYYKELTILDNKANIILIQNVITKELYVKKSLNIYSVSVYEQLKNTHIQGIPDVKECIRDDNKLIIIEEYLQGKNLKQLMDEQGTLSEQTVYSISIKLLNILIKLHNLTPPIIHRDIKPSNIIIDKKGDIYLIDFNAARHVDEDKNEDTRMLGTMYFAAPEQYGFGQSDERTDIYGFGATVNYLLTGDKPGAGIYNCNYSDVLKKCLMLDAGNRYQSVGELLDALSKVYMSDSEYYSEPDHSKNSNRNSHKQDTKKNHASYNGHFYKSQNTEYNNTNNQAADTITNNSRKKEKTYSKTNNGNKYKNTLQKTSIFLSKQYNKYTSRSQIINNSWRRYLLPGFRSLNPVHCLLAAMWYAIIIVIFTSLQVTTNNGTAIVGYELYAYRITMLILLSSETLWFGNYLNIRRIFPGMKNINIFSFILMFVYAAILGIGIIIILALLLETFH